MVGRLHSSGLGRLARITSYQIYQPRGPYLIYSEAIDRRIIFSSVSRLLVLQHLSFQPFSLLLHLLITPGLPILIIDGREARARLILRLLLRPKLFTQIRILALHHGVYRVGAALCVQVTLFSRDDMSMYVGHALPSISAILYRDVERGSAKDALDQTRHALHSED